MDRLNPQIRENPISPPLVANQHTALKLLAKKFVNVLIWHNLLNEKQNHTHFLHPPLQTLKTEQYKVEVNEVHLYLKQWDT